MSLCVFALITSKFMPVSLLTPMASDLQVSEGTVGQGIAISGLFAVLASLSVSILAGTVDRKALLLGLTAVMAVSGAVVALAPGYLLFMIGRALIGVVIGGFWSISAAPDAGHPSGADGGPGRGARSRRRLARRRRGSPGLWGLMSTAAPVGWWSCWRRRCPETPRHTAASWWPSSRRR